MAASKSAGVVSDRELVFTRVFAAPRELVWKAWTQQEHVGQWWGPNGFTTTTHEMNVKPGGAWRFIMHGPDGRDYPNRIHFIEVAEPERLVYRHGGDGDVEDVEFHVTVTFTQQGKQTALTMRMLFPSAEERERVVREYGADEGAVQTLNRLNTHLHAMVARIESAATERDLVISREFDAPRELVWKAWTDPAHVARWWGPNTFSNPVCEMDVRPGGAFRIVMRGPDGVDFPVKGVYREIVEPSRLVMTMDLSEHPEEFKDLIDPNRPKDSDPVGELLQTVAFEDLGGRTRLTIRTRVRTAAIRDAMLRMGGTQGWSESLERLADLVAKGASS
ncbi:MAG TPA: SRPBCC domain-containing protein [Candidatus Krumholzibacteria bacterium]|nr:SRPBCC domain-containing protein [Candidatus Krumholzibacteria bacterium]